MYNKFKEQQPYFSIDFQPYKVTPETSPVAQVDLVFFWDFTTMHLEHW